MKKNFNSDAKQDEFVANILSFKRFGYSIDIGSHHSVFGNNTYFFQELGWKSISIDYDSTWNYTYSLKKNRIYLNLDALKIDYKRLFQEYNFPKSIDYLSLDIDTLNLDVLKILPLNEYKFKVITIEHDAYIYGDKYREEQRIILKNHGYLLLCSNVYVEQSDYVGKICPFEDWWVDPVEFNEKLLDRIKSESEFPSQILNKF